MRAIRHALSVATATVLLVLGGCTTGGGSVSQVGAAPPQLAVTGSLVVLDGTGALTAFAARDLRPQWRLDLAARDPSARLGPYPRHVLAVDARRQVYVAAPPWLFIVDGVTGQMRAAVRLPADVDWLAPAVVDDGVYLAGPDRTGAPMVALVDAAAHQVTDTATIRPAGGRFWPVYATAVFAGGSRLAVSYHGDSTTGLDIVDLGQLEPLGCPGLPPGAECSTAVHGGVAGYPGGLLAATGFADLARLDDSGRVTGQLTTGLAGNHLREIAVDAGRRVAYAIGPCAYAGGLARVALGAGRTRLLAALGSTGPGAICGDRVLVAPGGVALAVVDSRRAAILDAGTGAVRVARSVAAAAVDAVLVG
ncbi:MAG: hypothetical protein V7603_3632 [Micromonosporaceae bacterium]